MTAPATPGAAAEVPAGDDAPAAPPVRTGLWRRITSLSYEALLFVAVLFVAGFVLLPLFSPPQATGSVRTIYQLGIADRVLSAAGFLGAGALYFGWFWTDRRRTLPMKTWDLALVTSSGGPLDWRRALLRYGAGWISPALALAAQTLLTPHGLAPLALSLLFVNHAWALFDRNGDFLHDRLAGTMIVDRHEPRGNDR